MNPAASLIKCETCGKEISVLADRCPGCGAPNTWIHPSITYFLSIKDQTGVSEKFTFWSNKTELWGNTEKRLKWWMWVILILCFPIFTVNLLIGIIVGIIVLAVVFSIFGTNKTFKVNFQTVLMGSMQRKCI